MVLKYEINEDLKGKVVLITGASAGIGRETARALSLKGAHLVLMGRTKTKYDQLIAELKDSGNPNVDFIEVELESLDSVKAACQRFLELDLPLHVLINNAGLAGTRTQTQDGYEVTFGVNHLAHFLITKLLLEKLKQSAPSRIVTVSSKAHYNGIQYNFDVDLKKCCGLSDTLQAYHNSKLANVMHSRKLSQLLKGSGVTTYSLHPGVISTEIWRNIPWPFRSVMKAGMISEVEGSYTSLYCATEPALESESGLYYDDCQHKDPNPLVENQKLVDELWDKSMELLKEYL